MQQGSLADGLTAGSASPEKVYTVPTGDTTSVVKYAVLSIMVLNDLTDNTDTKVTIYIANGDNAARSKKIDIASLKPDGGKVTVNCNCVSPGDSVFILTSKPNMIYRVEGIFEVEKI